MLSALRLDAHAPTDGEARLAAAVYAAGGGEIGPVPLPLPDLLAARQLAAVAAVLPAGTSVWATAQVGALAFGLLTAVLLWPILRRLGCGGGPTALGVTLVGVTPPAVALHSSVLAAAVGVPWRCSPRYWPGADGCDVLPRFRGAGGGGDRRLVGAAVLALAAHAIVEGTLSRRWTCRARHRPGRRRRGGGRVAVAASGSGPLARVAAPPLPAA